MKTKSMAKKAHGRRHTAAAKKQTHRREPRVTCLHRSTPGEFSCGVDDTRALLVEESLDERERRG